MNSSEFSLSKSQEYTIFSLGEVILGVSRSQLGKEFINEANAFISNLDPFLQSDLNRLLNLFDSRLLSFLLMFKLQPFTQMEDDDQERFFNKWVKSRIGLLRTGASTLRALCGWSYYSLEKSWEELEYPGKTLGREDETPTLLEGKTKWHEDLEVDEII